MGYGFINTYTCMYHLGYIPFRTQSSTLFSLAFRPYPHEYVLLHSHYQGNQGGTWKLNISTTTGPMDTAAEVSGPGSRLKGEIEHLFAAFSYSRAGWSSFV